MPGPRPPGQVEAAALAVATGQPLKKWAEAHSVPLRTAQRWTTKPTFRRRVQELRRRLIDQSIGTLTVASTAAAVQLAKLATESQSEQVRLSASRAILSDLLAVQGHAELEQEIRLIKERLAIQEERRANRKP